MYVYLHFQLLLATQTTVDSRSLKKVLIYCQKSSMQLDRIVKKQDILETMVNEQNEKIVEVLSRLEEQQKDHSEIENNKGKEKVKRKTGEFYQVNIHFILFLFSMLYLF